MLRSLFRSQRSVRVPLKSGTVDLQRVAITRKSKSSPVLYRLFTTVAVTYFVASTINYVYPESAHGAKSSTETVQKSDDRTKIWQEHWDKANASTTQDEPEVIHLMLPIWIRQKKPQPWQPNDPTWKSFQTFQGDAKRVKEVVETIKKPLMRTIQTRYGGIMMALSTTQEDGGRRVGVREAWRMAPPLFAPATYEVPCIFIEPNKTSYGWRQLPNSVGGKIRSRIPSLLYWQRPSILASENSLGPRT